MIRRLILAVLYACTAACGRDDTVASAGSATQGFEPPVLTNAETPVRYPPRLFAEKIEGTVVLRLYVDATGQIVPDSTRIAEGSGQAALDSAALVAVPVMQFAPARRGGQPVSTAFLQPVHFRHPEGAGAGGGG